MDDGFALVNELPELLDLSVSFEVFITIIGEVKKLGTTAHFQLCIAEGHRYKFLC